MATTETTTTRADMLIPGDEVRLIPGGSVYLVRHVGPYTDSLYRAAPGEVCILMRTHVGGGWWEGVEIATPADRLIEVVKWADE